MKKVLVIAFALAATPAMAIDMSVPITDLQGNAINNCPDGKPDCGVSLMLSDICITALLAQYPDERDPGSQEKVRRFKLAQQISDAKGDLHLAAEDIATLKGLIGKAYKPLIVGRAFELLDPVKPAAAKDAGQ